MNTQQTTTALNADTVRGISKKYPWATEPALRWWIFNAQTNGFEKCIVRVGRKILIDIPKFEEWVASNPKPSVPPLCQQKPTVRSRSEIIS